MEKVKSTKLINTEWRKNNGHIQNEYKTSIFLIILTTTMFLNSPQFPKIYESIKKKKSFINIF